MQEKSFLKDKTIIITGAARIGQVVAASLKDRGANLTIAYLKDPQEAGDLGFGIQADVSKEEDVQRVVSETIKSFGKVDGLVHMAAIYEKSPWQSLGVEYWQKNMDIIAKSAFLFGKILGDALLKNSGEIKGKMIFFSDWSVLSRPYVDYLAYNTAKSAVVGLTKSLAKELAPGVLVNAIAPGPILMPLDLTDQENEEVMSKTPLKKWGGAEEIAKGVVYLMESNFVTGQILTIDGGRTIA
jgi:pteridine reductase